MNLSLLFLVLILKLTTSSLPYYKTEFLEISNLLAKFINYNLNGTYCDVSNSPIPLTCMKLFDQDEHGVFRLFIKTGYEYDDHVILYLTLGDRLKRGQISLPGRRENTWERMHAILLYIYKSISQHSKHRDVSVLQLNINVSQNDGKERHIFMIELSGHTGRYIFEGILEYNNVDIPER